MTHPKKSDESIYPAFAFSYDSSHFFLICQFIPHSHLVMTHRIFLTLSIYSAFAFFRLCQFIPQFIQFAGFTDITHNVFPKLTP